MGVMGVVWGVTTALSLRTEGLMLMCPRVGRLGE